MVRTAAPSPDVSTEASLRRTLLAAEAIICSQGSPGQSIDATQPQAAAALLQFLATPQARRALVESGVE